MSVIDMPPTEDTIWWRGKRGFEVGRETIVLDTTLNQYLNNYNQTKMLSDFAIAL